MREILFRGKVADEPDEWVIGYLSGPDRITQLEEHSGTKCCAIGDFAVKEETIGQYTGLKDINGKKIFEGDIVRIDDIDFASIYWDEDRMAWGIKPITEFYFDSPFLAENASLDLEVIGNIYNNPELLEE